MLFFFLSMFYYPSFPGYETLSSMEPSMRQMMNKLVQAQNDYLEGKNQLNISEVGLQLERNSPPIYLVTGSLNGVDNFM
jgi:hypothetical protein